METMTLSAVSVQPPNFRPISVVAKRSPISATAEHLLGMESNRKLHEVKSDRWPSNRIPKAVKSRFKSNRNADFTIKEQCSKLESFVQQ